MNCDIIIPVWNELRRTIECVESILANTDYPYRIIFIDNASEKPTADYLEGVRKMVDAQIIRNKTNEGFVRAINQGLAFSKAKFVCIMNNDTVTTNGWLGEMVRVAGLDKRIGVVNPSSNNLGQRSERQAIDVYAAALAGLKGQYVEMGSCVGFCMLIKREVIEKISNFDEVYKNGNFEETDFCRRAEKAGYISVRAKAAYVYHYMKSSFVKLADYEESFRNNQEIYNRKWGKPRRLLYIVTRHHGNLLDWIGNETLAKARGGNWVWLFFKDRAFLRMIQEHSNIKTVFITEHFFDAKCIVRILKKKKRFDTIYADDIKLVEKIKRYKRFHQAETMLMGG